MTSNNSIAERNRAYLDAFIDYERQPLSCRRAYNLKRMQMLLEKVGNPQRGLRTIHIAGTNGKGSVAALIFSILSEAGMKTGLYSSPHLISYRERIRTNNGLISEEEVSDLLDIIKPAVGEMKKNSFGSPTFFEVYTALAFLYFHIRKVDFAIMEVGMGGCLDATNLCESCLSVITRIAIDHSLQLGADIVSIAGEKAGIIKEGVPVIVSEQSREVAGCIEEICGQRGARLVRAIRVEPVESSRKGTKFRALTPRFSNECFSIPLLGRHQLSNAACAISAVTELEIDEKYISPGLENVCWPGRAQFIEGQPSFLLDGGHNPSAAVSLKEMVKSIFSGRKLIFIMGISSDKDITGIGRELSDISDEVIFTRADNPRAASPAILKEKLGEFYDDITLTENLVDAIAIARKKSGTDDLICITGSLFLIGEALDILGVSTCL